MKKIHALIAIAIFSLVGVVAPSQAQAAPTFGWASSPLTNLDPAGATINGGFTSFPSKAGLYIQECIAPVGTARPTTCSDTLQLWVTATGGPGASAATGPIVVKVAGTITGKGVTVDCTTTQCGLFFRYDHTAPTDFSEDKFYPITFKSGVAAPVLPSDEITVTLNGTPLVRNVPSKLAYRADAKIVATSKSGIAVTLTSLTPDCSYSNGVLVALKGVGQCALAYSTAGNTNVAPASGNFPFILIPGEQSLSITSLTLKKGGFKTLPTTTNFGGTISYRSISKNCRVEVNLVTAASGKSCLLVATAPAVAGKWNALRESVRILVK
jgi:hypothetical protein